MTAKPKTVPELRFPGFEGEWENRILRDHGISVIDGDRGKNYPNGDDFSPMGYCLFLNAKNVTSSGFAFNEVSFISETKDRELSKGKLKPEDVVLTTRGTVGNIAFFCSNISYRQMRINSGMVLLRAGESKISPKFLYSAFFAPPIDGEVKKTAFGSAQPQLTVKGIYALKFGAPTLPEQRKIADFLTAVDGRIGQLNQKKGLLEDYKKGVMQQLFTQALRFKDDHGNDFPEWEEKSLGEIGDTYGGLSGKAGPDFGTGKPFITYKQIFDRSYIDIAKCGLVEVGARERQNKVKKGDIFFTTSSETRLEVGFSSVLLDEVEDIYLNSFCFGFRPFDLDSFIPTFAQFLFRSAAIRRAIGVLGQGSTRYNISKRELMKQKIKVPSPSEQTKIANFLTALDRKIESVSQQITHTQTFKKGLLQQMFV